MRLGIGNENTYNAFPTMLYTFFYDFNYLGIIMGPLIFGLLALFVYQKMLISNSFSRKGIYIMIVIMIYQSTMRWEGIFYEPWIVIFLFIISGYFIKRKV